MGHHPQELGALRQNAADLDQNGIVGRYSRPHSICVDLDQRPDAQAGGDRGGSRRRSLSRAFQHHRQPGPSPLQRGDAVKF